MAWDHNFISTEFYILNCIYVWDEKAMTPWWCDDGHISLYFPVKSFMFHQEDGPNKWARSGVGPVKREVNLTVNISSTRAAVGVLLDLYLFTVCFPSDCHGDTDLHLIQERFGAIEKYLSALLTPKWLKPKQHNRVMR